MKKKSVEAKNQGRANVQTYIFLFPFRKTQVCAIALVCVE